MIWLVVLIILLVLFGSLIALAIKYGGEEERNDNKEKTIKHLLKVKYLRDLFNSNSKLRERLRERYKRNG